MVVSGRDATLTKHQAYFINVSFNENGRGDFPLHLCP